ncbi:MAG: hypothetical protein AB2A00_24270 [Myxococcota bacterium]
MTAALLVMGIPALTHAAESKPTCHGLSLPQNSKKVAEDSKECRYISPLNWDETLKFFSRNLPSAQTKWHREINIPAAKYLHVESSNPKSNWEGINIYQVGGTSGEIRMFIIPRPVEAKPAKAEDKADDKGDKKGKKKKKSR